MNKSMKSDLAFDLVLNIYLLKTITRVRDFFKSDLVFDLMLHVFLPMWYFFWTTMQVLIIMTVVVYKYNVQTAKLSTLAASLMALILFYSIDIFQRMMRKRNEEANRGSSI